MNEHGQNQAFERFPSEVMFQSLLPTEIAYKNPIANFNIIQIQAIGL